MLLLSELMLVKSGLGAVCSKKQQRSLPSRHINVQSMPAALSDGPFGAQGVKTRERNIVWIGIGGIESKSNGRQSQRMALLRMLHQRGSYRRLQLPDLFSLSSCQVGKFLYPLCSGRLGRFTSNPLQNLQSFLLRAEAQEVVELA